MNDIQSSEPQVQHHDTIPADKHKQTNKQQIQNAQSDCRHKQQTSKQTSKQVLSITHAKVKQNEQRQDNDAVLFFFLIKLLNSGC